MIYVWFTAGIDYYKLAVEKDRDSIFTTITTIWKPDLKSASSSTLPGFLQVLRFPPELTLEKL